MSVLARRGGLHGRPLALAVTIALHGVLVAGLLAMKVVAEITARTPPIRVTTFEEERKPLPPEIPIVPVLGNPPAVPHLVQDPPDFRSVGAIDATESEIPLQPVEREPGPVAASGTATPPDTPLKYQAVRPANDYYPAQALRMGAEGAAVVRTCVDAQGRLSAAPTVVRTSRVPSLDAAALKWAREALRFEPATQAGVAVAACKEFRVSFQLH